VAIPPNGTHARVLAAVRRIPRGRVATYGQIASLAGLPRQARLVGYVLAALDDESRLPWHRVINAAGAISARREGPGGAVLQRLRLEREGVVFDARGRVDLERFRWTPRPRAGA
jgi:methylated-DNA-protein-cysteine methyltransferase-like protein